MSERKIEKEREREQARDRGMDGGIYGREVGIEIDDRRRAKRLMIDRLHSYNHHAH